MKIICHIFFITALALTSFESAASIIMSSDYEIAHSDSVSIIKITSGKCVVDDCASLVTDKKHLEPGFIEYRFICRSALAGNCPDIARAIPSFGEYCINCNYLAFSSDGRINYLIEIREDDTRVVSDGRPFEQPIAIYDSGLTAANKIGYQYFKFTEFLEAVNSMKDDYHQPRWNLTTQSR